jgi:hypothetical protein
MPTWWKQTCCPCGECVCSAADLLCTLPCVLQGLVCSVVLRLDEYTYAHVVEADLLPMVSASCWLWLLRAVVWCLQGWWWCIPSYVLQSALAEPMQCSAGDY